MGIWNFLFAKLFAIALGRAVMDGADVVESASGCSVRFGEFPNAMRHALCARMRRGDRQRRQPMGTSAFPGCVYRMRCQGCSVRFGSKPRPGDIGSHWQCSVGSRRGSSAPRQAEPGVVQFVLARKHAGRLSASLALQRRKPPRRQRSQAGRAEPGAIQFVLSENAAIRRGTPEMGNAQTCSLCFARNHSQPRDPKLITGAREGSCYQCLHHGKDLIIQSNRSRCRNPLGL